MQDHTLIKPMGKRRFSASESDWIFLFPEVPGRLKTLEEEEGYQLVIFTNQNGLERKKGSEAGLEAERLFRCKIEEFYHRLQCTSLILIAATQHNIYRKPRTGMWDHLLGILGKSSVKLDKAECFFVGDAAGRPHAWREGASKDFASTDRKFALNLGITFWTPEEFFLRQPPAPYQLGFDPKADVPSDGGPLIAAEVPELVVLVGLPASGKTWLYEKHFRPHGYAWINQDVLKTRPQCLKALKVALEKGESAVIGINTSKFSNSSS